MLTENSYGDIKKFKYFLRNFHIEEVVLYGFGILFLGINILVYGNEVSVVHSMKVAFSYLLQGSHYYGAFFLFLYILYVIKIGLFLNKRAYSIYGNGGPVQKRKDALTILHLFLKPIRYVLPIVFFTATAFTTLANASFALRFSTYDPFLLFWDQIIFHTIPFIYLTSHIQSTFWYDIFRLSYGALPVFMGLLLCVLFLLSQKHYYKKLILSFTLVFVIAVPFWFTLPCQDPYNYFVGNIRGVELSPKIEAKVATMDLRAKKMAASISESEMDAAHGNAVPVSCFPSMHASWSSIIVFFAFLISPWTLIVTIPWFLSLLLGGLYFSQHYGVDYLLAIPVTLLALWISSVLVDMDKRLRKNKKPPESRK